MLTLIANFSVRGRERERILLTLIVNLSVIWERKRDTVLILIHSQLVSHLAREVHSYRVNSDGHLDRAAHNYCVR